MDHRSRSTLGTGRTRRTRLEAAQRAALDERQAYGPVENFGPHVGVEISRS